MHLSSSWAYPQKDIMNRGDTVNCLKPLQAVASGHLFDLGLDERDLLVAQAVALVELVTDAAPWSDAELIPLTAAGSDLPAKD
jgi:hypothetical protein